MAFTGFRFSKSTLTFLSGVGFMGLLVFFIFFMPSRPMEVWLASIIGVMVAAASSLFFLIDELKFKPNFITTRNSNLLAGMLFLLMLIVLLWGFKEFTVTPYEWWDGMRIFILTLLSSLSTFLFLFSGIREGGPDQTNDLAPPEDPGF